SALGQGPELRPHDGWVDTTDEGALGKAAIRTGKHIFAAYHARIELNAPGHQLRVLHNVRGVTDHAWNEHLAVPQLDSFPDLPLMRVSRIRSLNGITARPYLQNEVDDVL